MILLNLNHFLIIIQAELCLKDTLSKFHVCYHFFRYENPREKIFINPSCPIINWNKKWLKFSFLGTERNVRIKKKLSYCPLIPLGRQGLRLWFARLPTYIISIFLTIEIHKSNIDTFRITNKHYDKIIHF